VNTELLSDDRPLAATASIPAPHAADVSEAAAPANATARSVLRWIERVTPMQLAVAQWIAAAVMVYVVLCTPLGSRQGLLSITESWGALERVGLWQRALSWMPGAKADGRFLELPPGVIVWSFRLMLVGMFAMQAIAFWQAWRGQHTSFWRWMVGPIGAHLVMLLMVPSNADVFFYEMSGDIANQGFNPYLYPLYDFPDNPVYPYNHWVEMTTVYGPFWTDINRVLMKITGPDPVWATVMYKIVLGATALLLAVLVWWFAKRLTNNAALAAAAGVLVAWQPNMIFETSGQAHNDPVMLLLMTAGVMMAVVGGLGALRGALVLVTASTGIKYVTLPVLGLLGILRITERREPKAIRRILGGWVLDGIAIVATLLTAYLPYWGGFQIFSEMIEEPKRNFSHPIWSGPWVLLQSLEQYGIADAYESILRSSMQLLTFAVIGYAIVRFVMTLWRAPRSVDEGDGASARTLPSWTGPLLIVWAISISALSLIPTNVHSWYWTWPIVPIALYLGWKRAHSDDPTDTKLPRWFFAYLIVSMAFTLIDISRVPHP